MSFSINKTLCLLFALCLLGTSLAQTGNKCRALALEGGGDKGAYEAGAIYQFVSELDPAEVQYDFFSGVSAGALNTGACVLFDKGEEKQMADFLINIWQNVKASDIYKEWPLGLAGAVFFYPSLYDTTPLREFLRSKITTVKRKFSIGTVNSDTGDYVRFTESELVTKEDLISGVLCSSAIPAVFPYQNFKGVTYIDGGTIINLDIGGAVKRCRDEGFADQDIIIDAVLCSGGHLQEVDVSDNKTLEMFMRYYQIDSYAQSLDDLLHAQEAYPDVNFRYVVVPSKTLPSGLIPLNFDKKQLQEMIDIGKADAKAVIGLGEGVKHKELIEIAKQKRKERLE